METSKARKSLSFVLAIIMLFTMIPTTIFTFATGDDLPVMKSFNAASGDDFHKYYKQVYTVTFLDEIDTAAMEGALEKWDISATPDSGEVMSWMYLNEEATAAAGENRYDVYVAGEGGVEAHESTTHMFYVFSSLKEVNGMENLHTGKVKSFLYWFGNCNVLESIDLSSLDTSSATSFQYFFYNCNALKKAELSSWNTSNVTTLQQMFYRCYALESADLSGWDTSKVTNMKGVFEMTPPTGMSPDYSLKSIDLTDWDTSNVTTMENMFKNCEALTELDLSSFDTSKVTTMRFMFYYCKSLKNIYVGEGWTTEAIANINDGVFNCCYALVGGTDDPQTNQDIYNDKHPSAYYPPDVSYAKTKEENGYLTDVSQKPEPEKKEYKVTYEFIGDVIPDGVTAPGAAVYEEGSQVYVADKASADGYIFSGWTTEDASVTDNSFIINNDVHFVGSWSKLYTVTYKYKEGFDVPEGAPALDGLTAEYEAGEWVDVFGVPYVDRYLFIGWTTEDADVSGDMFIMPENDVVLYGYFKIPVESIEIMMDEDLVINEDETVRLNVYVKPEDATIKDIIYESSDETVATVDKYGNIIAVGEGTAVITVKSADDETKSDTVTVTVKKPVTELTVDKKDFTLDKGEEDKINATVNETATNKKIIYESKDEEIVTVDKDGNIKAVNEGTTTVIVYPEDNPSLKEEITVTVKNPVTDITVPEKEITLEIGDEKNAGAKVNEDATNKELTYHSDNPGVAKVDKYGNIIAVGEGTATVTVKSADNDSITETVTVTVYKSYKVTYEFIGDVIPENVIAPEMKEYRNGSTVTVEEKPEAQGYTFSGWSTEDADITDNSFIINNNVHFVGSFTKNVADITVDKTEIELEEGETDRITVTVTPDDAANKKVIFESDDEAVVKVDEDGNIIAVGEGEATITVKSEDGGIEKKVTVTVKKPHIPVSGISVNKLIINLTRGETDELTVTVGPENATNKEVEISSDDEDVVTIDENGTVTAVGKGTATITVTSKDNPNLKITIPVTVSGKPVSDILIPEENKSITLDEGDEKEIGATVKPEDADYGLTYESDNPDVAEVTEDGKIIAKGEGEAIITVRSEDGKAEEKISVTVKKPYIPAEDIRLNKTEISLEEGKTDKITATVTPENATDKKLTFSSDDETVVKVDENGNVTAIGEGEAEITVTGPDGTKATVTVTVTAKPTEPEDPTDPEDPTEPEEPTDPEEPTEPEKPGYTIEVPDGINMYKGETKPLGIVITPDDGSITPTFTSSDESVVKVDAHGNIRAVGVGIAVITADFGGGYVKLIPVTVLTVPVKHHVCFGKTDGIGWYEVSVNGGDTIIQGPNSTLEVTEGSVLVIRVQDMWIDDEFDFYVNGKKVPLDPANTITVVVDGYMLIGALSMDVPVPDVEESTNLFKRLLDGIIDFFARIKEWFNKIF
ncbi:MAG: BspA family leucine-rich repeat surface protein [Ruminococcaceae bacterium]|nr:BspA family leucine-rich repeat surface protein [Oscillospiraceae bacterium]